MVNIMENPIKNGWFGGPTPIFGHIHVGIQNKGRDISGSVPALPTFSRAGGGKSRSRSTDAGS